MQDLLDPEIAPIVEMLPFVRMNAETLPVGVEGPLPCVYTCTAAGT